MSLHPARGHGELLGPGNAAWHGRRAPSLGCPVSTRHPGATASPSCPPQQGQPPGSGFGGECPKLGAPGPPNSDEHHGLRTGTHLPWVTHVSESPHGPGAGEGLVFWGVRGSPRPGGAQRPPDSAAAAPGVLSRRRDE